MIKALFMDFYGTVVYENGPLSYEVIKRVYKSGTAKTPEEIVAHWWTTFRSKADEAFEENYRTQYDLALENFEENLRFFKSDEKAKELCDMMVRHWSKPPIYEDTMAFLEQINLPVYFVTNSDEACVHQAIEYYQMKPAGIITSEQARCYKPRKEIFLYALKKEGLEASEVIHVGDSFNGDIQCPQSVGIKAILMNREKSEVPPGVLSVNNLHELSAIIKNI